MADYVSTLTGPQMDAALLDMAEHNSEAYAVGERNGIAVAPDDVTYHNNARYYAQIASSQIVGDASSAVRWDTDQSEALTSAQKAVARNNIGAASDSDVVKITAQTLTSAQQSQARANIMAGGSNRNLLDNPWFTVNQRAVTSVSGSGQYIADRWGFNYGSSSNTATRNSDGTITLNGTGGYAQIRQKLEPSLCSFLIGKTATLSVIFSDNTVFSATYDVTAATQYYTYIDGSNSYISLDLRSATQYVFILAGGENRTIKAMKLELGSVSTLANDAPPDYGEELAKCQRYFLRLKSSSQALPVAFGVQSSSTAIRVLVPTPVEMRAQPTVSFSGTHRAYGGGTASRDITSYTPIDRTSIGVGLIAYISSGTFASSENYTVYIASGGYLDLSADL